MEFELKSYIGAGFLSFGMTSDQIANLLGVKPRQFMKTKFDETSTDAYEWCHVFFKKTGECEAIEFFAPSVPTFSGKVLIKRPFSEVRNFFQSLDESIIIDHTGFTSFKYGIGVYAPFALSDPQEPVEGVIVFEEDYYSN